MPEFISPHPELQAVAQRMWRAAVECTGWAPETAEKIPVVEAELKWAAGEAHSRDGKLTEIRLYRDPDDELEKSWNTLAHEIGHAWATGGDATIREGDTELLERCIIDRLGLPPSWGNGVPLGDAPDPIAFDTSIHMSNAARSQGYRQALLLAEARGAVWGKEGLWAPDRATTVAQELERLREAGPRGRTVANLFTADELRASELADPDQDGVPSVVERLESTRPDTWDSDGDSWPDGTIAVAHTYFLRANEGYVSLCGRSNAAEFHFAPAGTRFELKPHRQRAGDTATLEGKPPFRVYKAASRSGFSFGWLPFAAAPQDSDCGPSGSLTIRGRPERAREELSDALASIDAGLPRSLTGHVAVHFSRGPTAHMNYWVAIGDELNNLPPRVLAAYIRGLDLSGRAKQEHRNLDTAEVIAQRLLGADGPWLLAPFPEDATHLVDEWTRGDLLYVPGLEAGVPRP